MGRILHQGNPLIGQIEEDHSRTKYSDRPKDLQIQQMPDTHHSEDQYFSEYSLEPDGGRQLVIRDGAHDTGDVVESYKRQERVQKSVAAAQEIPEPAADSGDDELNRIPEFLHVVFLLIKQFVSRDNTPGVTGRSFSKAHMPQMSTLPFRKNAYSWHSYVQ